MNWADAARCRTEDPDLFFPLGEVGPSVRQIERAKAVCRQCPVAGACLEWAIENQIHFGVWGGLSEGEREAMTRRANRHAVAR